MRSLKKILVRAGLAGLLGVGTLAGYLASDSKNREYRSLSFISSEGFAYIITPNKIANLQITNSRNQKINLESQFSQNGNNATIWIPDNLPAGEYVFTATDIEGNTIKETYKIDAKNKAYFEKPCRTDRVINSIGKLFGVKVNVGTFPIGF